MTLTIGAQQFPVNNRGRGHEMFSTWDATVHVDAAGPAVIKVGATWLRRNPEYSQVQIHSDLAQPGSYTFEELFDLAPSHDPATQHIETVLTLIMSQEDGRCAYGEGRLVVDPKARTARNANSGFALSFSDRDRFNGKSDQLALVLNNGAARGFDLGLENLAFGNRYDVPLELPPDADDGKLYSGWGDTIGHGRGKARHTLSFNTLNVVDN